MIRATNGRYSQVVLNHSLKNALSSAGIPVISKFNVSAIVEEKDQVTVVAKDGWREEGSFVIGCDGLNSVVRASILKSHNLPVEIVDLIGIVQVSLLLFVLENELKLVRYRSIAQRHITHSTINARLSQHHHVHLWAFFIFHVLFYYIQQVFMVSFISDPKSGPLSGLKSYSSPEAQETQ
jgi:hypothetical protein